MFTSIGWLCGDCSYTPQLKHWMDVRDTHCGRRCGWWMHMYVCMHSYMKITNILFSVYIEIQTHRCKCIRTQPIKKKWREQLRNGTISTYWSARSHPPVQLNYLTCLMIQWAIKRGTWIWHFERNSIKWEFQMNEKHLLQETLTQREWDAPTLSDWNASICARFHALTHTHTAFQRHTGWKTQK